MISNEKNLFSFHNSPFTLSGLTYMLARYYSQGYGTFISPDTFDLLGKINSLSSQTNNPEKLAQLETLMTNPLYWNKYIYCLDNPVNRVDKDGKFSVGFFVGVIVVGTVLAVGVSQWMDGRLAEAEKGQSLEKQQAESGDYISAKRHYDNRMKKALRSVPDVAKLIHSLIFVGFPTKPISEEGIKFLLVSWKLLKSLNLVNENDLNELKLNIKEKISQIDQQLKNPDLSESEKKDLAQKKKKYQKYLDALNDL